MFLILVFSVLQIVGTKGNIFLITFQQNEASIDPLSQCMTITTAEDENVHVSIRSLYPEYDFEINETISRDTESYLCVDNLIQLEDNGFSKKVINVSSDQDIDIMVHDIEKFSADSYVAIPLDKLGTEYYVVTAATDSQISITAVFNNTEIVIEFPPHNTYDITYERMDIGNPNSLRIVLNEYEVFNMHITLDLTGVYVSAEAPIAVVSGSMKAMVGPDGYRDHMADQLPPINQWGRTFITVLSPIKDTDDNYRIITSGSNNTIMVGNSSYVLHAEGDWMEVSISPSTPEKIESEKPILVSKIVTGHRSLRIEPCLIHIPPNELMRHRYAFKSSRKAPFLIVVVESEYITSLYLKSNPLNITNWVEVPNTNFSTGYILLDVSLYTLESVDSDIVFAAYIHQTNRNFAYCSSLGMHHMDINEGWIHKERDVDVCPNATVISPPLATTPTTEMTSPTIDPGFAYPTINLFGPTSSEGSTTLSSATGSVTTQTTTLSSATGSVTTSSTSLSSATGSVTIPTTTTMYQTTSQQYPTVTTDTQVTSCPNIGISPNITMAELLVLMSKVKDELKVTAKQTSQALRKRTCVEDNRLSAVALGCSGWSLILLILMLIVLNDLSVFCCKKPKSRLLKQKLYKRKHDVY